MYSPSVREVSLTRRRIGSGAVEVLATGEDSERETLGSEHVYELLGLVVPPSVRSHHPQSGTAFQKNFKKTLGDTHPLSGCDKWRAACTCIVH